MLSQVLVTNAHRNLCHVRSCHVNHTVRTLSSIHQPIHFLDPLPSDLLTLCQKIPKLTERHQFLKAYPILLSLFYLLIGL